MDYESDVTTLADGGAELEGEPETPEDPTYADEDPNLVRAFLATETGKEFLKELSERVVRRFDRDWDGGEKRRDKFAADLAVLYGDVPKTKDFPFEGAARAHVPAALQNMSRIIARVEAEFVGDWQNVFNVSPTGPDDMDVAQLLTLHGNWQIREKMPDFKRQVSKGLWVFFFGGDVTSHTWWDPELRLNRVEMLTPDDFVVPYAHTSMMPDYGDLPWYTKILPRYRHQLEAMRDDWVDVDRLLDDKRPSWDDEPDSPIREARAEVEGIEKPDDDEDPDGDAPYKLLWHEGWFTLPGQTRQRWCKIIMDKRSKAVLSLTIHEQINWQERVRFERQLGELKDFRAGQLAVAEHEVMTAGMQAQMAEAQMVAPMMAEQMAMQLDAHAAAAPVAPEPPSWMRNPDDPEERPEEPRKDPIRKFKHGVCIEPLAGIVGVAMGSVQADLNVAADTMLSQFIDQATLGNAKCFLTTDHVDTAEPIKVTPGKFTKVPGVMDLKSHIMPLDFGPANPQLPEMSNVMLQFAESVGNAPGILAGEAGKSGETFRGHQARLEQATKQLSVPAQHFADFMAHVFRDIADLNAVFMDDDEMFSVLDHLTGQNQVLSVGKKLYQRDYRVSIRADMRFASTAQRIAEADELVQMPVAVPALQQNLGFQWYTAMGALRARGRSDVIPYLGRRPEPVPVFGMGTPPSQEEIRLEQQKMQLQIEMQAQAQQLAMASGLAPAPGPPGAPPDQGGPPPGPPQQGPMTQPPQGVPGPGGQPGEGA